MGGLYARSDMRPRSERAMRAVPDFSARDHAGRLTHHRSDTRRVDCES